MILVAAGTRGKLLARQKRESCWADGAQSVSDASSNLKARDDLLDSSLGHLIVVRIRLIGQGANVASILLSSTCQMASWIGERRG